MLRTLNIQNFRSIRSASIQFAGSGLTVVVGANGSGKSNLIRCFDFLGSVMRNGLDVAVRTQGGVDSIVPKALTGREIRASRTSISYTATLHPIAEYPPDGPSLTVDHDLILKPEGLAYFRVAEERLRFSDPLLLQYYADRRNPSHRTESPPPEQGSLLTVERSLNQVVNLSITPAITSATHGLFWRWFGLPGGESEIDVADVDNDLKILQDVFEGLRTRRRVQVMTRGSYSILERGLPVPTALSFSIHADGLRTLLGLVKRYDLQLTELRKQQRTEDYRELQSDGRGLPGALRVFRGGSRRENSWSRLIESLREIAPHIVKAMDRTFHSGEEYVQFFERASGRPVESWNSSDGTLRALAILLALETAPETATLLIEEPEQGLHPWAIGTLVDHMRRVIAERNLQVVLTTHSQQVLDAVDPAEVLVATRTAGSGTQFKTIEATIGFHSIERGEVGRIWVSGALGGVPKILAIDEDEAGE